MNQPKLIFSICTWIVLYGTGNLAMAENTTTQDESKNSYGQIHFNNDKGEEKCVVPIPEISQKFYFVADNEPCENNMVSTFWLENVPSATLIDFYENEGCTDTHEKEDFYFKLRTVKQPTDWGGGSVTYSIDALRNARVGQLLPKRNVRLEATFVGADYNDKNLNERLSCVYIERSQPVK
jgi:hypothetical protein